MHILSTRHSPVFPWALLLLLQLPAAFAVEPAAKETPAASKDAAEQAKFDIWEYRVLGNTVLPATSIERAVYPFLGSAKTFADVEEARKSLENAYRSEGYGTVFVDIPEQSVDDGVVRLKITEAKLDRVHITGARYFSNGRIRAALPALASGEVPRIPEMQQQLTALNSVTADRSVTPVLKAGRTPGTIDLDLKVNDKLPIHGSLDLNDRYTADTSRLRLNGSLNYDNLFQLNHRISLQYQMSPQKTRDVEAYIGNYSFRTERWPSTMFALYGVVSKTDVAALGTLSVIGNGSIIGARAIRILPAGTSFTHNVTFGLDYKDFLEDIQVDETTGLATPIRYLNWSTDYSIALPSDRSMTNYEIGANFGVRSVVNKEAEFEGKRFQGATNYLYLRASAQHLHQLPAGLQVFGRLSGQFTQSALVSNEQFAIGGADTVRGYLESTALGDYGVAGTFELRSSSLAKLLHVSPGSAYFLLFGDGGVVSIIDPQPSQTTRFDLYSWGAGLRLFNWHGLDLEADWAQALTDGGRVEAGDTRIHFSVKYGF